MITLWKGSKWQENIFIKHLDLDNLIQFPEAFPEKMKEKSFVQEKDPA